VCPSQALLYATPEQVARTRREKPTNVFYFGNQRITTKVFMMAPADRDFVSIDIADYMTEETDAFVETA
jgi:hypothetical protein